MADTALEPLPDDWNRALAVVAHPDDMESGPASAVARWTAAGKWVGYVLVTRGEAGIATMPPEQTAPIRETEQRRACEIVGVESLEYLERPDGLVVADLALRRDIAGAIRRHRPEIVITANYRTTWGGRSWNHVDHRHVGVAVLDAVRDAANPWLFAEIGDAWNGVRLVACAGSPEPTHYVDVTDTIERGMASLRAHEVYNANLGPGFGDAGEWVREHAVAVGAQVGVGAAVSFEVYEM